MRKRIVLERATTLFHVHSKVIKDGRTSFSAFLNAGNRLIWAFDAVCRITANHCRSHAFPGCGLWQPKTVQKSFQKSFQKPSKKAFKNQFVGQNFRQTSAKLPPNFRKACGDAMISMPAWHLQGVGIPKVPRLCSVILCRHDKHAPWHNWQGVSIPKVHLLCSVWPASLKASLGWPMLAQSGNSCPTLV